MKIPIKKILSLKLLTMLKFENIKVFLLNDILPNGQKKFLLLVKLKGFYEKELQKANEKEFRIQKGT